LVIALGKQTAVIEYYYKCVYLKMQKELTVFYTDDDKDDQELFREIALRSHNNLKLVMQSNGKELIDQLGGQRPAADVIFLDFNMPLKNGFDTLTEFKVNKKTRDIPIIIFSTAEDPYAIDATRKMGASLYIKPRSYDIHKEVISYSFSINWDIFRTNDQNFVYNINECQNKPQL
jgi:response regulator RpfG family c-di-GMP phosphodiesterase